MQELYRIPPPLIYDSYAAYSYIPDFDPHEYLAQITTAKEYELISRIINAESGWKVNIKNATSSASGLGQFIDGTFESQCVVLRGLATSMSQKNDPKIQIDCMVSMIRDGGLSHWDASRHIWGI